MCDRMHLREQCASSFKTVLLHINTKLIQAEEFEKDKADPTKQTLQIYYAIDYDYDYTIDYDYACIKMRCQEHFNLGRA